MAYSSEVTGDEVVTLEVAKQHLRVTWDDDDGYIYMLIQAAREWAETYISQALVGQTVTAYYDAITAKMPLPLGNATSITAIRYLDGNQVAQTLTEGFYLANGPEQSLALTVAVPDHSKLPGSVSIEYESGYVSPADAPQKVKSAILLQLADLYENREAQIVREKLEQNLAVTRLLQPLRRLGV